MMATRRQFMGLTGGSLAALCSGCVVSPQGVTGSWNDRDLEQFRRTAGTRGSKGLAAWQGQRQVFSQNPNAADPALSITKSIAALAVTRAAAEGWLQADENVADTITEWRNDSLKSRITVRMLLQQVSGLEAGVIPLYRNQPPDKGKAAVALQCTDFPGSVFRYGPGHWETLAEVMRRKLASKNTSLIAYLNRAVMSPVGLNSGNWRADKQNTPYFSTGTVLTLQELGRLGNLVGQLAAGKDRKGFSASHFAEMTRPSRANPMFGGGLWRNPNASRRDAVAIEIEQSIGPPMSSSFWDRACLSTRQPPELLALVGSGARRVFIWPDTERRIALHGSSDHWSDTGFLSGLSR